MATDAETTDRRDDGFEYDGTFYTFRIDVDHPKDLMLIDRITDMPLTRFSEILDDPQDRIRGPIKSALVATSIRAQHPDWTVQRIMEIVSNVPMSQFVEIFADSEEQFVPPAEGGTEPPPISDEPSNGSSSSSTPEEAFTPTDETSSETRRSSSSRGSRTGSQEQEALST